MELSHIDARGRAQMVDVGEKDVTRRTAVAEGFIEISSDALELIQTGSAPKGDVLACARIAGISAAKRAWELIPLCHNITLECVGVDFEFEEGGIRAESRVSSTGKTGAEMEALTAVSVALLTIYDMVKAADKSMTISGISLLEKSGGKSGSYKRKFKENA